ncbi:MAG: hypothetical protein JJLCMIEE_01338 [Acidimicrobiales bacterium]|nr:MAG: hypothetical protein EDR02_06725 [Actinomycetota bacterium]MBV6508278.1 hypothetical protein [Acidimicrobiales bacterium]RIK07347.1 MAG: hypothetical protein DCC48_04530 [Acidobacteriota bacterium]
MVDTRSYRHRPLTSRLIRRARHRLHVAAAALAVGAVLGHGAGPALAQTDQAPQPTVQARSPEENAAEGRDPNGAIVDIHPDLDQVELTGSEYSTALAAFRATQNELYETLRTKVTADATLEILHRRQASLQRVIERETVRRDKASERLEALRDHMKELAVESFMHGNSPTSYDSSELNAAEITEREREEIIVGEVSDKQALEKAHLEAEVSQAEAELEAARAELASVDDEIDTTTRVRDEAAAGIARLTAEVIEREREVDATRKLAEVAGADFPLVALDAYYRAAQTLAAENPSCGLRWQAIAGIYRVESHHGTFGDAELTPEGGTTEPIIGIPLDGSNNTAVITDTDGGAFDADPVFDRAVGPGQFIPSTWVRFAEDQTGDGKADPHNLYDAALATATYLCYYGPGLDSDEGLARAFFGYNHSGTYVAIVLGHTHGYDDISTP